MIHTGQPQDLLILRDTGAGLFLGDGEGNDVLLPNKYVPAQFTIGDRLHVFVYRDSEDRIVATTLVPRIQLGECAFLPVKHIGKAGAFVDIGLEKDLLVPFREQQHPMEAGRSYVVYMGLDNKTDRLYGSTRIERHLLPAPPSITKGAVVDLLVHGRGELGWSAVVQGRYRGLVYANETFKPLSIGLRLTGHVKHVREDGKLDISLQPIGYERYNDGNTRLLAERLRANNGFLPVTDKTSPEEIHRLFGISKKAFKQALGALYKARHVQLGERGITWTGGEDGQ